MQLKSFIVIGLLLIGKMAISQDSLQSRIGNPIKVRNDISLYREIQETVHRNRDSLTRWETHGSFFVRFTVNKEDRIENVMFSRSAPLFMINLLDTCFKEVDLEIEDPMPANIYYVIPVSFAFEGKRPATWQEWGELIDYYGHPKDMPDRDKVNRSRSDFEDF